MCLNPCKHSARCSALSQVSTVGNSLSVILVRSWQNLSRRGLIFRSGMLIKLDKEPYRYQQFISDIAGQDIQSHNNRVETIVRVVRNWLRTASGRQTIPGGNIIWERYQTFLQDLPQTAEECQLDVEDLIFNDYLLVIAAWQETNDE